MTGFVGVESRHRTDDVKYEYVEKSVALEDTFLLFPE
jgi:hypothetical protein